MDENDRKVFDNIEKYGCHVIYVFDTNEIYPPFTYSVGIQKSSNAPEVVVVGLKKEISAFIVNEYNRRVREGEQFVTGKKYDGFLEGFEVFFEPVNECHYKEYFGYNIWLYGGHDFKVLQVVWPSTTGIWPWQEEASEWLRNNQPMLGNTPFAVDGL